jgi:uncharacterized protein YndB with AHSA1/START domain
MPQVPSLPELELSSERWFPFPPERLWAQCTSKQGLESWWSPEDLRTTVKRIDPRPGGEIVLSLRYAPPMLEKTHEEAFRAAGIPLAFTLRGKFLECEIRQRLTLALTLSLNRAGAGIETVTQLDFQSESGGTRVRLGVRGPNERHIVTLGKANLQGQLERLGRSLGMTPPASR